jgi:flagellar basal-body rod protein FlgF
MDNTTYIALSRQQALWNQLEVIANNLANVNTTGFKGSDTLFSQYLVKSRSDDRTFKDKIAFTHDFGLVRNLAQGTFNYTGNTFDLALQGEGYFVVQKPGTGANAGQGDGEDLYTRAGAFTINGDSQLVTQSGNLVMGTDGQPIHIPDSAGNITIQGDGSIHTPEGKTVGQIRVVRFDNERELKAVDGTAFRSDGPQPIDMPQPKVAQGVLEDSNVNAISEMTRLINVNRSYADIAKLVDEEHTRKRQAADTFTRQVTA